MDTVYHTLLSFGGHLPPVPYSAVFQRTRLGEEVFLHCLEVWKELGVIQESGAGHSKALELLENHMSGSEVPVRE